MSLHKENRKMHQNNRPAALLANQEALTVVELSDRDLETVVGGGGMPPALGQGSGGYRNGFGPGGPGPFGPGIHGGHIGHGGPGPFGVGGPGPVFFDGPFDGFDGFSTCGCIDILPERGFLSLLDLL